MGDISLVSLYMCSTCVARLRRAVLFVCVASAAPAAAIRQLLPLMLLLMLWLQLLRLICQHQCAVLLVQGCKVCCACIYAWRLDALLFLACQSSTQTVSVRRLLSVLVSTLQVGVPGLCNGLLQHMHWPHSNALTCLLSDCSLVLLHQTTLAGTHAVWPHRTHVKGP
jgi:hypothetical protein